jgi:hypothetical protein
VNHFKKVKKLIFRRVFNMKKKNNIMMIALAAILIGTVSLAFGFGGGGRSEDPLGDLDAHLQGPAVNGTMMGQLVLVTVGEESFYQIEYTITGTCKGTEISPPYSESFPAAQFEITNDNFCDLDAIGIESIIYGNGYPAACRTAKTGTDMVVIKAKNVVPMCPENGPRLISAEIVGLSVVYR